jgi:GTPase SAR1 family protein
MSNFDISLIKFKNYQKDSENLILEDLSESDTRSKIIDLFLIEVLGWKEFNIRREGHVDSGYFDYVVSLNNFRFVIEAKRSFHEFQLPVKGRRHKIKSLYKQNKDVINQIRSYLIDIGLTHGVITNGKQFIISRFINIDGTSWQDNDALIFQSLEKIDENFIDFYNLLSYEAIEQNGRIKIQTPSDFQKKIIDSIANKNQELVRNDFSSKLLPIIDKIFNEIGNTNDLELDKDLLEDCYVPTIDIHKYSDDLKGLFIDLPPTFDSKISKVKNTISLSTQIKENLKPNQMSTLAPSPIILIGGKGAGKTTFIRYFFKVVLSKKESKEIPSVYLDFRNYTHQQIEDTNNIYNTILRSLLIEHDYLKLGDYSILKQIFKQELDLKHRGAWSKVVDNEKLEEKIADFLEEETNKPIVYLTNISTYLLKFQRRNLCLIFDNADQLDNESQKKIFLLAQSLKGTLNAIVFVSLREGYFYQWKDKPPFDAFHSNVYHISAPPYSDVLRKRIQYIIRKISFDPINTYVENKRVEFEDKTLRDLFQNLHNTLFSSANGDIMRYLEQTSYPNIRKGLEEMNDFLISGHTKIDSYITSQPTIPIWEFIKSIGLNNKLYYTQLNSVIYNIFSPNHTMSDHFLKVRLLKYLYDFVKNKGFKEEYISTEEIINTFLQTSYSRDCIIEELDSLLQNGLLATDKYNADIEVPDKISLDNAIRISNTGIYYLNELINKFHYIDLILQDTPIFSEAFYKLLIDNFSKSDSHGNRNLLRRMKTVEIFIEYLEEQERLYNFKHGNFSEMSVFDFNVTKYIKTQFNNIDKPRLDRVFNF